MSYIEGMWESTLSEQLNKYLPHVLTKHDQLRLNDADIKVYKINADIKNENK